MRVSRGQVKPANRRYSTLNCQYEITLDSSSLVEKTADTDAIPVAHTNFSFTQIRCVLTNLHNNKKTPLDLNS